jgi:antitoxin YefM
MLKRVTRFLAQASLADLIEEVNRDQVIVLIGRRGAADVAMLPAADLSALLEMIYLLRSPMNAQRLLSALDRAISRKTFPDDFSKASDLEGG